MGTYEIHVTDRNVSNKRGSFFGHDSNLKGLVPNKQTVAAHLILTIDLRDSRIQINDWGPIQVIRLIHPFYYSEGDIFVYRHINDNEIEFINFDCEPQEGWPHDDFPQVLPQRDIRIKNVSKSQAAKSDRPGWKSAIFMGEDIPTVQEYSGFRCESCGDANPKLIAVVHNRCLPEFDLWGNDYVNILFWSCSACKCFMTHTECD